MKNEVVLVLNQDVSYDKNGVKTNHLKIYDFEADQFLDVPK